MEFISCFINLVDILVGFVFPNIFYWSLLQIIMYKILYLCVQQIMIFSLVYFDIHNVYVSCKIYNKYVYIYLWMVQSWMRDMWTCGRSFVDEISWT